MPDTIGDAVLARLGRLSDDARLRRPGRRRHRALLQPGRARRGRRPAARRAGADRSRSWWTPRSSTRSTTSTRATTTSATSCCGTRSTATSRRRSSGDCHAQAAEFVMNLEASSIVHASRHYERAGLRTQAYRASLTGAEEAGRISARHESWELYRRAIDNMPADLSADERAELYRSFSDAAIAHRAHRRRRSARPARRDAGSSRPAGSPRRPTCSRTSRTASARTALTSIDQRRALISQGLAELEAARARPRRRTGPGGAAQLPGAQRVRRGELRRGGTTERPVPRHRAEPSATTSWSSTRSSLPARSRSSAARTTRTLDRLVAIAQEARDAGYESVGVTSFRVAATMAARVMDYPAGDAPRSARASSTPTRSSSRTAGSRWPRSRRSSPGRTATGTRADRISPAGARRAGLPARRARRDAGHRLRRARSGRPR